MGRDRRARLQRGTRKLWDDFLGGEMDMGLFMILIVVIV